VLLRFVRGWKTKIKYEAEAGRPIGVTTLDEATTCYDCCDDWQGKETGRMRMPLDVVFLVSSVQNPTLNPLVSLTR
jgi:hypothetical protein